jgi:hypothetical protein
MRPFLGLVLALILILLGAVITIAVMGVVTVQNTPEKTNITIDKKEMREKSQEAVEKTKEAGGKLLEKAGEGLHKAGESIRESKTDNSAPAPTDTNGNESPPDRTSPADGNTSHADHGEHQAQ